MLYFLTKRKTIVNNILYFGHNIFDQVYINKWKSLADMYWASGRGGRWGVLMQAFSFMFWVLQTAVKIICFESTDTIPVQICTFK